MMGEMKEWVCGEIIAKGGEHKRGWVSFKWKGWRFYKKKKRSKNTTKKKKCV